MTGGHDDRRHAELIAALGAVRARIAAACAEVGRDPYAITLVAVTKTYPVSDIAALVRIGVRDVGESRDQEARAKVAEARALLNQAALPTWHFVGRLQSRKCKSVASYAGAVHSLDRIELVARLADGVTQAGREPMDVFVQVSLDDDPDRGGVPIDRMTELAAAAAARDELRLRGVMAVAPLGADADAAFARLAAASARLRDSHPEADAISAGMTEDFESAIKHGSTHVRVGSALLGRRGQVFS